MKKIVSVFMAVAMLIGMGNMNVFAAEEVSATSQVEDVRPYGSLSGYGSAWNDDGSYGKSFNVNVKGTNWTSAGVTLKISDFAPNVRVDVIIKYGNKVMYQASSTTVDYLSMSNTNQSKWSSITIAPGYTGNYTVTYRIHTTDGGAPSHGRVMCWIY